MNCRNNSPGLTTAMSGDEHKEASQSVVASETRPSTVIDFGMLDQVEESCSAGGKGISTYLEHDWLDRRRYLSLVVKWGLPGRIVDVGCGLGYFVECCSRFGMECIGLEGSAAAVERARKRDPALEIQQHQIENGLPFDDESVSTVFCDQVIEHLYPDVATLLLSESYRVLEPGGRLFLLSPCRHNSEQAAEPTHINLYTPSGLNAAALQAGFTEVIPMNYPRPFLGRSRILRGLAGGLFMLAACDVLSSSANLIAIKGATADVPVVRSTRYFHVRRLMTW